MPPPTPLHCQVPGCDYTTPVNTPTWDNMIQILKMHREDVHQPAAPAPATPAIKIERLPRPVFSLNMSEAAWQFKVIKWRSYINQTPLTPDEKLQQLRAACDEELSQRVYNSGGYNALDSRHREQVPRRDEGAGCHEDSQVCPPEQSLPHGPGL